MKALIAIALAAGLHSIGSRAPVQQTSLVETAVLQRALDEFKTALDERWSYRHASRADFGAAIGALGGKIAAGMSIDEFGLELHKILALGIDGHSGVDGYRLPGNRYFPFLLEPEGERFVAFTADRTAFLADGAPYLTQIDGRDVSEWCRAGSSIVPKGSPQYVRHRCLARTRSIDFMRDMMKLPHRDTVDVALASKDGTKRRTLTVRLAEAAPAGSPWPPAGSRTLEGNVAYLRLTNMVADPSVQEIKQWMPRFRASRGLIIDVRDNNGGDRDALRLLYSYLAAPDAPPRVFNAAAYRLHPTHPETHLARNHSMYRAGAAEWSDAQSAAVSRFAGTFKARWELPKGQFSDWHFVALVRLDDRDVYYYGKPTVVLLNGRSFSATDIFLAGLKGMPNVTLLGTPSGGGSAHTQQVPLGQTALRLRIGSMASFQADGRLFDGNGVHPDIVVEPAPEYYIGGMDNVLAEATKHLQGRRQY